MSWLLGPETAPVAEEHAPAAEHPSHEVVGRSEPYLFILPKLDSQPGLANMVERMQLAIKQSPESLRWIMVENRREAEDELDHLGPSQRALIFGPELSPPISCGEWQANERGGQYMLTHALNELKTMPELKKQTWDHLQKFAGMK